MDKYVVKLEYTFWEFKTENKICFYFQTYTIIQVFKFIIKTSNLANTQKLSQWNVLTI